MSDSRISLKSDSIKCYIIINSEALPLEEVLNQIKQCSMFVEFEDKLAFGCVIKYLSFLSVGNVTLNWEFNSF